MGVAGYGKPRTKVTRFTSQVVREGRSGLVLGMEPDTTPNQGLELPERRTVSVVCEGTSYVWDM